jgi:hypothetical protein
LQNWRGDPNDPVTAQLYPEYLGQSVPYNIAQQIASPYVHTWNDPEGVIRGGIRRWWQPIATGVPRMVMAAIGAGRDPEGRFAERYGEGAPPPLDEESGSASTIPPIPPYMQQRLGALEQEMNMWRQRITDPDINEQGQREAVNQFGQLSIEHQRLTQAAQALHNIPTLGGSFHPLQSPLHSLPEDQVNALDAQVQQRQQVIRQMEQQAQSGHPLDAQQLQQLQEHRQFVIDNGLQVAYNRVALEAGQSPQAFLRELRSGNPRLPSTNIAVNRLSDDLRGMTGQEPEPQTVWGIFNNMSWWQKGLLIGGVSLGIAALFGMFSNRGDKEGGSMLPMLLAMLGIGAIGAGIFGPHIASYFQGMGGGAQPGQAEQLGMPQEEGPGGGQAPGIARGARPPLPQTPMPPLPRPVTTGATTAGAGTSGGGISGARGFNPNLAALGRSVGAVNPESIDEANELYRSGHFRQAEDVAVRYFVNNPGHFRQAELAGAGLRGQQLMNQGFSAAQAGDLNRRFTRVAETVHRIQQQRQQQRR